MEGKQPYEYLNRQIKKGIGKGWEEEPLRE